MLDVMRPDIDGSEVAHRVRADGLDTLVLFLSARGALDDRIAGFGAGGADYVTTPFALAEIVVRVHAIRQRSRPAAGPSVGELAYVDLRMDPTLDRCGGPTLRSG